MILRALGIEILSIQDFAAAILENGRQGKFVLGFFSGNIAIIIPVGPLKKIVPPMEDQCGVQGDLCWITYYNPYSYFDEKSEKYTKM